MRVLISVQNYRPAYSFGGRVGNAVALAEGLHRLGHEVMVLTSSVVDRQRRPALRTRRDCINGVSVTYLGTWLRIGNVSLNPAVLGFAASEISRFDAVHIIGLYDALGPAIAFSARRNGIPYSVEPSGMTIPIVRSLRLKRVYHALFGYSMLMGARAIVVTSKVEWDEALGFGIPPEKLVIRHNGIDLEAYKSPPKRGLFRRRFGIPECTPMVLWLGRIEVKKNLEGLLEAISGLKGLPWTLVIVGPSESQDYLRALHRLSYTMGIEERVRFVPGLYGEDKLSAFLDADLFVLVSINENWGNTVLEAIALGVPVLVTRTCGVAEVVEGRAGLVVDLDVSAIRDGLKRLLTDSDLYRGLKSGSFALLPGLSWDKPVSQMADLFQSWKSYGSSARSIE